MTSSLTTPTPSLSSEALEAEQRDRFYAFKEIQELPSSDRDALFEMLRNAQAGDPSALETVLRFAYEERPVPIDEFILGKRYLGLKGLIANEKIDILTRADHPRVREAYLMCGTGAGKGFMVSIMLARTIYRLLCLRRPDLYYMLGPGSGIAALSMSVSKDQARNVIYAETKARMEHSPWFSSPKKYKDFKYHATFPKKIAMFCQAKQPNVSFGYNTFFACLDEVNFMLQKDGRSQANDLTEAVMKSLNSRFPGAYKFAAISTLRDEDDYLSKNINAIKLSGFRVV
jgi:hypothetical protein